MKRSAIGAAPRTTSSSAWRTALLATLLTGVGLGGCTTSQDLPPIPAPAHVDLTTFMGDWYVIANIPTVIEKEAYQAVERYELNEDGSIATTFSFRDGGFDLPVKTYHPKGFVTDTTNNAVWGMQFIWPFKADYRIAHVDAQYQETVIARTARDYVWIMARTPTMSVGDYCRLLVFVEELGYDLTSIRQIPQVKGMPSMTCPAAAGSP
jgi:apolipoprotein D and lipocalin family protein